VPRTGLLLDCLRDPSVLDGLSGLEWEQLLREAEAARLSGRIAAMAAARGDGATHPAWLRDRLFSARALGAESTRALLWELNRLRRAFADLDLPLLALKGAAYAKALPVAVAGRRPTWTSLSRRRGSKTPLGRWSGTGGPFFRSARRRAHYRRWMRAAADGPQGQAAALDVHHRICRAPDGFTLIPRACLGAVPTAEEGLSLSCT
jgi:hypothetical protein